MNNCIFDQGLTQMFWLGIDFCINVVVHREEKCLYLGLLSHVWLNPRVLGSPGHFHYMLLLVSSVTL